MQLTEGESEGRRWILDLVDDADNTDCRDTISRIKALRRTGAKLILPARWRGALQTTQRKGGK